MFFLFKSVKFLIKIVLVISFFLFWLFILFNWPVEKRNSKMALGVTFSDFYARELDLDWPKAYLAILDDLGVKKIRLAAYWSEIEKKPGEYDFSDLDWQIKEAEKRKIEVILALGIKVPRWPECFVPEFYQKDEAKRREQLLVYEKILLERYKNSPAIKIWQIENEPFLSFGDCPVGFVKAEILDQEIAQVRKIDGTRPILTTDSGELSWWYQAAKRGDIFGTTLYRKLYSPRFGYITYPIGPNFFRVKQWIIKKITPQKNFLIIELQAEPWGSTTIKQMSLEEQFQTMDEYKLQENIVFAQKTGFPIAYLWGAEWWYWLKEKRGYPAAWETAKNLFQNNEMVEEK